MALRTLPPHPLVAAGGDHGRGEVAVEGGVPLGGQLRVEGGQVVVPRQGPAPGAVGAAAVVAGAGGDDGLIGVPTGAQPPHLPVAVGRHLLGGVWPVEGGVPLPGDVRAEGGQVVFPGDDLLAGTHGTAGAAVGPGGYPGLPLVALFTHPPHPALGAGEHVPGGEGPVFLRVPLFGHPGKGGGQVVHPRQHRAVGAHGTAGAAVGPGGYPGLPLVALFTLPPDFAIAAIGNLLRRQGKIARGVPLFLEPV